MRLDRELSWAFGVILFIAIFYYEAIRFVTQRTTHGATSMHDTVDILHHQQPIEFQSTLNEVVIIPTEETFDEPKMPTFPGDSKWEYPGFGPQRCVGENCFITEVVVRTFCTLDTFLNMFPCLIYLFCDSTTLLVIGYC